MAVSANKKIYSVSEVTSEIKRILETNLGRVWIEGEISNFRRPMSGHMYFTVKDEKSQISAVLFRGRQSGMAFRPKDGTQVIVFGQISVYEPSGQYQIIVENIALKGIGELQIAFEKLKSKLSEEGLFDSRYKKKIPRFPEKIGVVTSPTGAAIRDIIRVITRRFGGINIILYPVKVQGEDAPEEIVRAIRNLNKMNLVDVMIVGRGGGSLEDLWAFNTESVAREIFDSRIPIVSAVGHQIDITISDFVADLRAATPSAAAEIVIERKEDIVSGIERCFNQLVRLMKGRVNEHRNDLYRIKDSSVFYEPQSAIRLFIQKVDGCHDRLCGSQKHMLSFLRQKIDGLAGKLSNLSPLEILERGYSVSTIARTGRLIRRSPDVKKGDEVKTLLHEGSFLAKVMKVS